MMIDDVDGVEFIDPSHPRRTLPGAGGALR
jgi:hypothetical protein